MKNDFALYEGLAYLQERQKQTEKNLKAVVQYLQKTGQLPEGKLKVVKPKRKKK